MGTEHCSHVAQSISSRKVIFIITDDSRMFLSDFDRRSSITVKDVDAEEFGMMLKFLYTGKIEIPHENIFNIISLADQFEGIFWVLKINS
jgi:hypothetical protein